MTTSALSTSAAAPLYDLSKTRTASQNPTKGSFEQQLAKALTQYLQQAGIDPAKIQVNIAPTGGVHDSGAPRQFVVTVSSDPNEMKTTNGATSAGPAAPSSGSSSTSPAPASAASPASAKPLPPSLGPIHIIENTYIPAPVAAAPTPATPADRYWAAQPKDVQALRNIEDPAIRRAKAYELASAGYQIDVPIMVWDWDPKQTMELRQNYGYTWVPSALQDPVKIAPGLSMPGMDSYDPAHPPKGSILVNTDFA